jgi:hypothetical protein
MLSTPHELQAISDTAALESCLRAVDVQLAALGDALKAQDAGAAECTAALLHHALVAAVDRFGLVARHGGVPPELRRRLAMTGGQVAAQREAVSRATSALDRAIDVLLPEAGQRGASLYSAQGGTQRGSSGGLLQA